MMNRKKPLSKKEDLVIQELPGELLIYNTSTDRAFCLNDTSAFVWKHADGKKTVGEIKEKMEREFNAPVNEDLIWLALDQLGKEELMEVKPEEKFTGISRREVVRRIGLSALIALPVIATVTTPVTVFGQSLGAPITEKQCSDGRGSLAGQACTKGTCQKDGFCR